MVIVVVLLIQIIESKVMHKGGEGTAADSSAGVASVFFKRSLQLGWSKWLRPW